ncbi:MAG TPA: DUF2812 domain-containing protein [Bacillota bacterium]|nr:DUF2812 domain-containing protein [Bacillota bacterium]
MLNKWKIFIDYQREEEWINEMARKGYHFKEYTFCRYTFEKDEPGKYEYRMELLEELPNTPDSKGYIDFMEENGIECVDTFIRWAYFRKETTDEPFEIYSDYTSRMSHMKRVIAIILAVSIANLFLAIFNTFMGSMNSMSINISYIAASLGLLAFLLMFVVFMKYKKNFKDLKEKSDVF